MDTLIIIIENTTLSALLNKPDEGFSVLYDDLDDSSFIKELVIVEGVFFGDE